MNRAIAFVALSILFSLRAHARHNIESVRRGEECNREYSTKSTDELIDIIENGENPSVLDLYELGRRNDPRISPLMKHVEENQNHKFKVPVDVVAKEVEARFGDKDAFDQFVTGLSSSTEGRARMDAIMALEYIGDRSAIKSLIPLLDDDGSPFTVIGKRDYSPVKFSSVATAVLKCLIPKDDLMRAHDSSTRMSVLKDWMKGEWWPSHRDQYASLTFGENSAFKKAASAPVKLRPESRKPIESFSGEVSGGRAFERKLRSGLIFKITPGYLIWMGNASYPKEDYCMVVTGPWHGRNALFMQADELESQDRARELNAPGRTRSFKCVADRKGFEEANWALDRLLWAPPAGEPEDTTEKARRIFDKYQETAMEGLLTIKEVRESKPGTEDAAIEYLKFEVQFFAPNPAKDVP